MISNFQLQIVSNQDIRNVTLLKIKPCEQDMTYSKKRLLIEILSFLIQPSRF